MSGELPPTAWPSPSLARLAATVATLAERVDGSEVRTQVYALAAVIENIGAEHADAAERQELEAAIAAARAADDEARALRELRRLTTLDRAAVHPVDWSAASRG